jgi:ABC-type multidrug transport system ATPase subunit
MSLGMKRKLAIVTAFMHDMAILDLDEQTSGLDMMMQDISSLRKKRSAARRCQSCRRSAGLRYLS